MTDPALLRSLDGGRSWRRVLSAHIVSVYIDPERPSLVIAAGRGIFRSTDGGRRWRQVFPGQVPVPPGGFGIHAFTTSSVYPDPGDPTAIYANVQEYITGALWESCYVSRDRGRTWTEPPSACQTAPFEWVPGLSVRPEGALTSEADTDAFPAD